jgi:hypothetical protein
MNFLTFTIIIFVILGYALQILFAFARLNSNEFKRLSEFLINLIPFPILLPWLIYKGIRMTIDNIKKLQGYNDPLKEQREQSLFDYQQRIKGV